MDAERLVRVERGAGGLRVLGDQLEVGERGQRGDDEGDQERQPGDAADLAGHLAGDGVDTGAEDVADDEQQQQLGAEHPLEVGVSGPLTSCCVASVALMETPVVIPCSARRPHTMNPPRGRGNHRSTPTTSCRRPGHAGQRPPAPGGVGWDALPGLYRSNYPAPHAEACCDPDRGRIRPLPLRRGGRPHRDLHATDPDVEIIAYRHGYHGLLTGNCVAVDAPSAGRRRAAARVRRQPDRQQPGQAHQRRGPASSAA